MSPSSRADGLVEEDGEELLCIRHVDRLPPFLMSVVSDGDRWLYLSSRGGLTAGRRDAERALFPYVTDDRLHLCHPHTGPFTLLRVRGARGVRRWAPLVPDSDDPEIERNLYKGPLGDRVRFEEVHHGLGLVFRHGWQSSDAYGFVRPVSLENRGPAPVDVELVDGLGDLLPGGVSLALQQSASCLVNAYTRAEVDPETGLGVIALQAAIVDQPIPAESLTATVVWHEGLPAPLRLLSTAQLPAFRRGEPLVDETLRKGQRAAYAVRAALRLEPGETRRWLFCADVDRDHLQVEALRARLAAGAPLAGAVAADVRAGADALRALVASADGLQQGESRTERIHHFANVLFNVMRGGVFAAGHQVGWRDLGRFLRERNRPLGERLAGELDRDGTVAVDDLLAWARGSGDADLVRLAHEYLPLTFSRRHGDPSRPWNRFTIRVRDDEGGRALAYEGNWRDIFQNWEALCRSHPGFLPGVIATFVDASTADGFNPYRLSRAGLDWERPEPDAPWASIGYWGDHQIVYLGRLLEALAEHEPGALEALLGERWFVYADVPYRLRSAAEIARDPRATIVFDRARDRELAARVADLGGDGKLLRGADGAPLRATLVEKLLVPVLAKLGNLVVGGGVWMNTQRPEWNDANNALVGDGLSVVTLCQLRRHLAFLGELLDRPGEVALCDAVHAWLRATRRVLEDHAALLERPRVSDAERRALLDALQAAFEAHRRRAYAADLGAPVPTPLAEAAAMCRLALRFVDASIRANRRADGLYHSYNLLELEEGAARVAPLYEMLEGQVAVLASGLLDPEEALGVIDALFASRLYRADQRSFLLYPDRDLPGFLEKNRVPEAEIAASPLLAALLAAGERSIVARDVRGQARFAAALRTVAELRAALARVAAQPRFAELAAAHGADVEACFARVFDLRAFTGRSGTMFGYEGLGCVYWHMVGKLLVAIGELHAAQAARGAAAGTLRRLATAYHRIRGGLGVHKTAREFGAFPTDPYSHTPAHAGAQQPGMTGQVKELVLARLGELGVEVRGGRVRFRPRLLRASELCTAPAAWTWLGVDGQWRSRTLAAGELGFTLCQTPVVYRLGDARSIRVRWVDGTEASVAGDELDAATSRAVLGRGGAVAGLEVSVVEAELCAG